MTLHEYDINPAIQLINEIAKGHTDFEVITEPSDLEVILQTPDKEIFVRGTLPLKLVGQVTMSLPTGYLIVKTTPDRESRDYTEYVKLMRHVAEKLSERYEVAYIHPLTPENAPKDYRR